MKRKTRKPLGVPPDYPLQGRIVHQGREGQMCVATACCLPDVIQSYYCRSDLAQGRQHHTHADHVSLQTLCTNISLLDLFDAYTHLWESIVQASRFRTG